MKIRYYRGPMDGKTAVIPDHHHTIVIPVMRKYQWPMDDAEYKMAIKDDHVYYRTKHTHPDGSVYFEWSKPKGTKIT